MEINANFVILALSLSVSWSILWLCELAQRRQSASSYHGTAPRRFTMSKSLATERLQQLAL